MNSHISYLVELLRDTKQKRFCITFMRIPRFQFERGERFEIQYQALYRFDRVHTKVNDRFTQWYVVLSLSLHEREVVRQVFVSVNPNPRRILWSVQQQVALKHPMNRPNVKDLVRVFADAGQRRPLTMKAAGEKSGGRALANHSQVDNRVFPMLVHISERM
jgi:hypothetical protein